MAVLFAVRGIRFDILALVNPWTAYVVTVTSIVAYTLSFLWLKGKSWWITSAITGAVATLVFLPSLKDFDGRTMFFSLTYVFAEWFVTGLLAHFACRGALAMHARRQSTGTQYW